MEIELVLRAAIASARVVELRYAGDGHGVRLVHPHALFMSPSRAQLLSAYQVGGYSSSPTLPAWRDFAVAKITEATALTERFEIAPDFDPSGAKYRHGLLAYVRP